ncbi:hypothetical protein ACFX13_020516 [Malus domestica]|uniref:E2F-associated phosphoprotein n=1 Tax=Malus domestica TaxID=3750 RepID=A0A498HVI3_MALDO|nr:hypothetical protein DVH24_016339 [Malus domestica]
MEMDKMTDDMASPSNSQKTVLLEVAYPSSISCRHEKYVTQYRAIFVENCKIGSDQIVHQKEARPRKGKRGRESSEHEATPTGNQTVKQVCCLVCSTEVGVINADEVYHFFNVLPSES